MAALENARQRSSALKQSYVANTLILEKQQWESEGAAVSTDVQVAGEASVLTGKRWYAVHTRARHEKVVAAQLSSRGIDTYLPLVEEIHRWSDRRKRVRVPLFAGYTFIRASDADENRAKITEIASVVRIVGTNPDGTPIPDCEIENVRRLLTRNVPCVNYPFLKAGQRVRVRGGALDGLEGTLLAMKGAATLIVSIELIQRSLAVPLQGYDVEVI